VAPRDLLDFMRGFGHMQANDSGWPVFDGRYASYPRFKKEWKAYRETYHSAVNNDLAARALRDKCLRGDALQMVSHLDYLQEIWETLTTCYERPEKYMEEALRPIVDFRRYKIADSAAVREFYSQMHTSTVCSSSGRLSVSTKYLLTHTHTCCRHQPSGASYMLYKNMIWLGEDIRVINVMTKQLSESCQLF
jgi:hypothetical protein